MDKKDIKKILKLKKIINNMESVLKKTDKWDSDSQIKNTIKSKYMKPSNNINNTNNNILENQIR